MAGACWAELEDGSMPPVRLAPGDIVVMSMGERHVLCSTPGMRAEANHNMYFRPTDRHLISVAPPRALGGVKGQAASG